MSLDEKAVHLQRQVKANKLEPHDYSPKQVRQAAVHARQDLVLVISYLSSATRLLASASR